ncbi:sensor histidine kinase [Companilactobacillus baiquanensis]|uniref:Sensor histidine kinase n=1 Tax=Companilactobacillus baiquanensis TaxID=2486005 RepID=A0ABW1UWI2_9LACO|nr:GHKL domain-containing protein [Companilactobacillus baiquanensis]
MVYLDWNLSLVNNFAILFLMLQLTHYFLKEFKPYQILTDIIISVIFAYIGLFLDDIFILMFVGFILLIQLARTKDHHLNLKAAISLVMAANLQLILSSLATYIARILLFVSSGQWRLRTLERYQNVFIGLTIIVNVMLVLIFIISLSPFRERITQTRLQIEHYHLGKRIFMISLSIFISLITIMTISDFQEVTATIQAALIIIFTILIGFSYWQVTFFIKTFALQTEAKEKMERNEQLNSYLTLVQKQYTELRKFKHDFQNIMLSLDQVLKDNDSKQIKYYYDSLLEEEKDLNNVQSGSITQIQAIDNEAIRGLLIQKFFSAKAKDINLNFELDQKHYSIEPNISIVRILGVLLDNAIEHVQNSDDKNITCAFFKTGNTLEITVDNKVDGKININQIFDCGYSTKKDHTGFGLTNVLDLVNHSSNLFLDSKIIHDHLMMTLIILGSE